MKLRNLLFGTMIACAFVACSNDDDPTPDKGQPEGTAKTVLEIRSNAALETKAGADEGINALTMVVSMVTMWRLSLVLQGKLKYL